MAIGFALRALARRRPRPAATLAGGMLDFSSPQAGALSVLITEDF